MASKMKDLSQQVIKFDYGKNFKDEDYFLSNCNKEVFNFLNSWPRWEKNFLNIIGEKFSGKTHLTQIFLNKYNGTRLNANLLKSENLTDLRLHKNIILENLSDIVDEKSLYSLINLVEQENKFLIVTTQKPIVEINFKLNDLKSRTKNFLLQKINKPDDELIHAIILKNFSDRQISIDNKFIDHILKRIDRSYGKIFDFIYKIDEISLKRKKSIDFKIINEVLGE